jgi:hemolysin III
MQKRSRIMFSELLSPGPEELVEHYPNGREHIADFVVHLVGLVLAAIGGGVLFVFSIGQGLPLATATILYAMSLLLMLTCSAIYNLTRPSRARRLLRRLDEGAIFLLIAGSYTPFTLGLLPPALGIGLTAFVWVAALAGAAGKVFASHLSDRFWCCVYVAFGWFSVVLLGPMTDKMPLASIALLAIGGVVYTVGVPIYLNHELAFRRAIWHGFVVVAAALHFTAIASMVVA